MTAVLDLSQAADIAEWPPDLAPQPWGDECGDVGADPSCLAQLFGPPNNLFPLTADAIKDPLESDQGVDRDADGFVVLKGGLGGTYAMLVAGCTDSRGNPVDTSWRGLQWDFWAQPGTTLLAHAKSGASLKFTDPSWSANPFTVYAAASPVDLQEVLTPNVAPSNTGQVANDPYLYIEFSLSSTSGAITPKLRTFSVGFKCASGGP